MSLHERFFAPADVVSDLRWVKARLLDPDAPEEERSHGRVHSPDLLRRWSGSGRRPERDGIFCQVIFGPIRPLACACGATQGAAHEGERCAECSVLCTAADLRSRRYGHLEVLGVLHPALVSHVAEALRLTTDEVRAIARCEACFEGDAVRRTEDMDEQPDDDATGPEALRRALEHAGAAALAEIVVTQAIPVPPPSMRPFTGGIGPAMIDPWIGPLNEAWRHLLLQANAQRQLAELAAPRIIVLNAQRQVQRHFESIVRLTASPPVVTTPWPAPRAPSTPPRLQPPPDHVPEDLSTEVAGVLFVDDDRLFIQRAGASWMVTTNGEVLARFPTSGRIATSVHGVRLRMTRWIGQEWDWLPEGGDPDVKRTDLAVLDLDTGEFLTTYPADFPQRVVENDQPEDLLAASVGDDEPAAMLRWGGDRPGVLATSRDGRFAWVGEGDDAAILDLETGAPQLDPVMQAYFEETDPFVPLSPDGEVVRDEADSGETATALGITPENQLRLLHGTGVVSDGERLWFRIDGMILAAGFSPRADRIAVAVEDEIIVIAVGREPAVLTRFTAPRDEEAPEGDDHGDRDSGDA